ncbi:MAG: acetate--CoA ligase family protein [Dehalococcoidia bacterium]|nr:acetate--CoA ligase family protein [Dehalococcoidia bacterium]
MGATNIIDKAKSEGRSILTEVESKLILAEAGIPVAHAQLAATREEAVAAARQIGLPVVLKIVSPDISHKSDVGGVKLNLGSEEEVAAAFDEIVAAARRAQPEATVLGVSVQKMARPGVEVIMGMTTDPQFGPVLMFGLGGVFVEVLKDVAFRIVPLEPRDARQMIRDIRGFPVLEGFRGQEPADLAALEDMLMRLSAFVEQHPEIRELDLNPIFAYKDGALAVDARIVLS